MKIDYFGYLGIKQSYVFDGGRINVVDEFEKAREWIEKYTNKDGFLYPPIEKRFKLDPLTLEKKEVIPKTEKPALLHKLPYTHSIEMDDDCTIEEQRKGSSAFIINMLGFSLGYRLQFHDWWFDGRVPIKTDNGLSITRDTVEDFLSHCFSVWKEWDAKSKKLITNLLYMFSRSLHYEWEWERFTVDYMVIDGIWKLYEKQNKIKEGSVRRLKDRVNKLCKAYKIPVNDRHLTKIIKLRNELFHETLWDKGQPCSAGNNDVFVQTIFLRHLITRLIPAILGYQTAFVKTEWWHLGNFIFDKTEK